MKSHQRRKPIHHIVKTLHPLIIVSGLTLLLCIGLQPLILGLNGMRHDRPVLGLGLEGYVIGQLGSSDFRKQVDTIVNQYENRYLAIKVANYSSNITLRQLGVRVDENQLYSNLLDVGRTGSLPSRLFDQNRAVFGNYNVLLAHPSFNNALAQEYISTLDKKIDIAPVNASFALVNQKLAIQPDSRGRAIDSPAAIDTILSAKPPDGSLIILPTKSISATVTHVALQSILPEVQDITKKPLTIAVGGSEVVLSREQLLGLIVPKITPDPKNNGVVSAQITFDEAKLRTFVDTVIKQAEIAPQPTIMNNGYIVRQGKSGVRAANDQSLASVLSALIQRQTNLGSPDAVQIPLIPVDPPVVQEITNNPSSRTGTGLIRLTFDDGPGARTEQVLDVLKRYNVHATFYVIGRNVGGYPGTMQRIHNEGHAIGNHSFSHIDLSRLSRASILQELASTQTAVQQACGVTPTAFRPPYGAQNQTVREVAASLGLSVDLWSVDPRDWALPGSNAITQRVLGSDGPGAVVLLHILHQQTVDALPSIIQGIRAQGYTLE